MSLCQAGDRTDQDLSELAQAVWEARPDRVSLREVLGYERGRETGEVTGFLHQELVGLGQKPEQILHHRDEVEAVEHGLEWARPGDLVVHLVHIQRAAVRELLDGL